ncbi:MAG: acyl-CoA thioesterase [Verrucomicrobia bacterium]|jgi:acyl-CoA thioester hydrolase|nr:acyl-CoA thioesterase [Verrucomicrobiota bacterium]
MAFEWKHRRRVEFSETDMAGIVHFSNFFRYMESAEHAFFRSLGHSVTLTDIDAALGLPRVHAHCDYKRPLRFEDEVEIHMLVESVKHKSITYQFRFYCMEKDDCGEEVARGRITVVCIRKDANGTMIASSLPDVIREQIQQAPEDLMNP